jgi:phospholipase C
VTGVVVSGTLPSTAGMCGTAAAPPATWQNVIWIWLENKASTVVGSRSAPYLTSVAAACGLATNYAAITHPSLPNYIAATSGDTQGITDDSPPSSHSPTGPSLYSQLTAAGLTWRDYEESAPGNCPSANSGSYAVRHDPAAYYADIRADCARWDVPLGSTSSGNLLSDLQNGSLPSFAFITPNVCNDMHDCPIVAGDAWLQTWLPKLVASPSYQAGKTAIIITFDENDGSPGNLVATVVVSPSTPSGTQSAAPFTHYSLLRTAEELLGISTYLGQAASATSMRAAFGL